MVGRWRGPLAGTATILVVTVPVMVMAEDWQGVPLIDHPGAWWLLPAAVAVAAFVAGGAVAARGRSPVGRALLSGLVAGLSSVAVLLAGDVVRRILYNPTLPAGVVAYWVEASAVALGAALAGATGAALAARRAGTSARRAGLRS
jgi:hypothetical protein